MSDLAITLVVTVLDIPYDDISKLVSGPILEDAMRKALPYTAVDCSIVDTQVE